MSTRKPRTRSSSSAPTATPRKTRSTKSRTSSFRTSQSASAPSAASSTAANRGAAGAGSGGKGTGSAHANFEQFHGWRALLNPIFCYHGFRMSVTVLTIFGLIMVFSSSSVTMVSAGASPWTKAISQAMFAVIGVVIAFVAMRLPESLYKRISQPVLILAFFVQLLTLTPLGTEVQGNAGWIRIGGLTFQPAEFMKYALCLWLPKAMIEARKEFEKLPKDATFKERLMAFKVPIIGYVAGFGAIMIGKDLGTGLIVLLIGLMGFWIGGFPGKPLLAISGAALALVAAFVFSSKNRMTRILATYTQCSADDIQGICYQSVHAKYALGSGGLFGVGIGNSREKWNYLPEAHNDFIYAIIGEETGFIGTTIVLILFVILGWSMFIIARSTKDRYISIALLCFAVWIMGQAIVNIGVVIGLLPVMGVPLPFVSAGGSSLVMCLLAAGTADSLMRNQPQIHAELTRV
ncbi:cell division protein FtsW [Bifidobacterium dolichotidis]|uniref:Probable peptidoglycan glycosyltransferase FtsW n=1 Tax=Bifidobacterium dolichotidis TaxID=2306976 RepID=A0A430FS64_9BIFI|nr:putative peptidoglycan glycosyltransferase FtsW [Bifidobacterium dolichotidis]RSX55700.1 cell division protein FtsW [Bifidobacterium dolichotidis]